MSVWDELVDEFRALGGTLENVKQDEGPFGRGLFAIDPTRPILIHLPELLLVKTSDIVFENGVLKLRPDTSLTARERKFYEDYYASLSWGGGGRAEIERILDQAQALPWDLRRKLTVHYRCGRWFEEPTTELVQTQFLGAREIVRRGETVLMPFIELANHGLGRTYENENGLLIRGIATAEVLVQYNNCDAYRLFRFFGFSCEAAIAYSSELNASLGGTSIHIECSPEETGRQDRPGYPKVSFSDGAVKLSFCMLGNRKFPRLCRGNFRHALRGSALHEPDEVFDIVRQTNQMLFLSLLGDLEELDGPTVRSLRRMARFQLQALTHCYGSRETPPAKSRLSGTDITMPSSVSACRWRRSLSAGVQRRQSKICGGGIYFPPTNATRRRLVEPDVPSGTPAVITMRSPALAKPSW